MYRHGQKYHFETWFKKISKNEAIRIWKMGKDIFLFGDTRYYGRVAHYKMVDWVRENLKEWSFDEWVNSAHVTQIMREDKSSISYWIPVKWYDRFSGEEVEAFDTVKGLEEYNHDYE